MAHTRQQLSVLPQLSHRQRCESPRAAASQMNRSIPPSRQPTLVNYAHRRAGICPTGQRLTKSTRPSCYWPEFVEG